MKRLLFPLLVLFLWGLSSTEYCHTSLEPKKTTVEHDLVRWSESTSGGHLAQLTVIPR